MTDHEKLLYEWKYRLGLHDWAIKLVDNCKPEDMSVEDVSGCTEWNEVGKQARIEMLDPQYYGGRIVPFDYEKTLVHESPQDVPCFRPMGSVSSALYAPNDRRPCTGVCRCETVRR